MQCRDTLLDMVGSSFEADEFVIIKHSCERNTFMLEPCRHEHQTKSLLKFTYVVLHYEFHLYPSHSCRASPKLHVLVARVYIAGDAYKEGTPATSLESFYCFLESIATIEIALNIQISWDEIALPK